MLLEQEKRIPKLFWFIIAFAFAIRLIDSFHSNFHGEEISFVAIVNTISLNHLPLHSLDHPLMNIYVAKASEVIFGSSPTGMRMLHILMGVGTVAFVFLVGRKIFSTGAGLWAAMLLAIDQFHIGFSRTIFPEVLMLFFAAVTIHRFLIFLDRNNVWDGLLLGLFASLAYLSKEPGILLLPVFISVLVIYPQYRVKLKRPEIYIAVLLPILVIGFDFFGNSLQGFKSSHLHRNISLLQEGIQVSMKPLSLFLGEFVQLFDPVALDVDYYPSNLYACNMFAGFFYLVSIVFALMFCDVRRNPGAGFLFFLFGFVFLFFVFLPGCEFWDPFWWASLCLLPAVLIAGYVLNGQWSKKHKKTVRTAGFCLILILVILYIPRMRNQGHETVVVTVEQIAKDRIRGGWQLVEKGDLVLARRNFVYALNIGGDLPEAVEGIEHVDRLMAERKEQEE